MLTEGNYSRRSHSESPNTRRNPDEHGDRPGSALEEGGRAANSCSLGFGCRF